MRKILLLLVFSTIIVSCSSSYVVQTTKNIPDISNKKIGILQDYQVSEIPDFKAFARKNAKILQSALSEYADYVEIVSSDYLPGENVKDFIKTGDSLGFDYLLLPEYYIINDFADYIVLSSRSETANIELKFLNVKTGEVDAVSVGSVTYSSMQRVFLVMGAFGYLSANQADGNKDLPPKIMYGAIAAEAINLALSSPEIEDAFKECLIKTTNKMFKK